MATGHRGHLVVIAEALEDLSPENLAKFRLSLRERNSDGPRVRRARVEGKNHLELADLLVDTFNRDRAVQVTVELLRAIGCNGTAAELEEDAKKQLQPAQTRQDTPSAPDLHFVDRHRMELTERVSNINPVLDLLLHQKVLSTEQYDTVRTIRPTQEQMRFLYQRPLTSGGERSKDLFLSALKAQEPYLIQDLKDSES